MVFVTKRRHLRCTSGSSLVAMGDERHPPFGGEVRSAPEHPVAVADRPRHRQGTNDHHRCLVGDLDILRAFFPWTYALEHAHVRQRETPAGS